MSKKIKSAKILNIISLILVSTCFILFTIFFIDVLINQKNNDYQGLGFAIVFIIFLVYGSIINGVSFILSIISYCLISKLENKKKKLYLFYTISIPCFELFEIGLFYLLSLLIK